MNRRKPRFFFFIPDMTLIWWCGAYQYCLKLLLYRCIRRHCSFCFWDESSSSHFFYIIFFLLSLFFLNVISSFYYRLCHWSADTVSELSTDCSSSKPQTRGLSTIFFKWPNSLWRSAWQCWIVPVNLRPYFIQRGLTIKKSPSKDTAPFILVARNNNILTQSFSDGKKVYVCCYRSNTRLGKHDGCPKQSIYTCKIINKTWYEKVVPLSTYSRSVVPFSLAVSWWAYLEHWSLIVSCPTCWQQFITGLTDL